MKLLAALGLLAVGLATGLASVALHQLWWGLSLSVLATAATMVALPAGWWTRLPFALGWVGCVGWLVNPRPEGDYAIGSTANGYFLLGTGVVVLVAGIATLPRGVQPGSGSRPS